MKSMKDHSHWRIHEGAQGTHAHLSPKNHFHAAFRKEWPNNRLMPPLGNPGSATVSQRNSAIQGRDGEKNC